MSAEAQTFDVDRIDPAWRCDGLVFETFSERTRQRVQMVFFRIMRDDTEEIVACERRTRKGEERRHWHVGRRRRLDDSGMDAIDATNSRSWLGTWLDACGRWGFEPHGLPYLVTVNQAEMRELVAGRMPRALVLRLNKSNTALGIIEPWKE